MGGAEPEGRNAGISRGRDEPDDAERTGPSRSGENAEGSTEYSANAEPGGPGRGYVEGGEEAPKAADVDPHEPPGQG